MTNRPGRDTGDIRLDLAVPAVGHNVAVHVFGHSDRGEQGAPPVEYVAAAGWSDLPEWSAETRMVVSRCTVSLRP